MRSSSIASGLEQSKMTWSTKGCCDDSIRPGRGVETRGRPHHGGVAADGISFRFAITLTIVANQEYPRQIVNR